MSVGKCQYFYDMKVIEHILYECQECADFQRIGLNRQIIGKWEIMFFFSTEIQNNF